MDNEGSFFKRIPSEETGIRIVLLENRYYWVVPEFICLAYNRKNKTYELVCKQGEINIKAVSAHPTVQWVVDNARNMTEALHAVDKLRYRTIPEKISIRHHSYASKYLYNAPKLARTLLGKPHTVYSRLYRNEYEDLKVFDDIEYDRDVMLRALHTLVATTPKKAVTLHLKKPTFS